MTKQLDGIGFKEMVDYAVRNLNLHCETVNQLNVFPVPDGDTGTNMVTTVSKGLLAVGDANDALPSVSRKFAHSVVFEARGNSGVIMSQFLKGMAELFFDLNTVNGEIFIKALENGVECAYAAVANPVEGTMLTVLKEATQAVKKNHHPGQDIEDIISNFVKHAQVSLDHTPELLPVLKESGVVDSGGAGVVYLFEGMRKYLSGEELEAATALESKGEVIDYDAFDKDSCFEYGYCTELLIQLLNGYEEFSLPHFKMQLEQLGDSIVISEQGSKVRIHVHTKFPEQVFILCHRYGEFLSLKVENMTVQHNDLTKKLLCSRAKNDSSFGVVAVACDTTVQKLWIEMGADVSIYAEDNVSTKDYLDAFKKIEKEHILVFPNSSDAVMAALQAKKMYPNAKIEVINSRNIAECYAALPTIDFGEPDAELVADQITSVINSLYVVSVAQRKKPIIYREQNIYQNEYYSFSGKELLLIGKSVEETAVKTIAQVVEKQGKEIVTIFHRKTDSDQLIGSIISGLEALGVFAEVFTVPVESLPNELWVSFE